MLKNYLRTALRGIVRNRSNTIISVVGLVIGLSAFIAIALFIQDELQFDQFHKNKSRIYRIAMDMGPEFNNPLTPMPLAPALQTAFPEIEKVVRLEKDRNAKALFTYDDKRFYETDYMYADSSVFDVFTFHFIAGDPHKALTEPNTLILTESTARRYFGTTNALNKIIRKAGESNGYKVTGIVKDFAAQSHFHFNFLLSFASLNQEHKDDWLIPYMFTYILVKRNASVLALEKKINALVVKNFAAQITQQSGMNWNDFQKKNGHGLQIYLQPLTRIHLHSNLHVELEANSNYKYIWLFGSIAVFILLLSCVNFINLATASASVRAKEIAVRKIVGALPSSLIRQFLFESFLLCFVSLVIAGIFVYVLLPYINGLTGKEIEFQQVFSGALLLVLFSALLVAGLLSGSYPAFYLSALRPVDIFKKAFQSYKSGLSLRRVLIVVQFSISLILIIGVLVVGRQLRFMNTANLGFQKDQLVVLPIHESMTAQKKEEIKNELLKNKAIESVTLLNYLPGKDAYENQDVFIPQGKPNDQFVPLWYMRGDWDLLKTMGFQLLNGRDFNPKMATDSFAYILNETAVKQLGWHTEDAVGKTLSTFGNGPNDMIQGRVIGVVKDFHFEDFTQPIKPMLLGVNPHYWWNIAVRIRPENSSSTMAFLEQQWKTFQPDYPFEYYFENQLFSTLWTSDKTLTFILGLFTTLAFTIACIGLFGLSVFAAERRTKEIGIRKVLGASVFSIINLLSKEYLFLVLIAFAIAAPVAAWLSTYWLRDFAYRAELNISIFLLAGCMAVGIAFVTMSFRSVKAATANPVKNLRTE